MQPYKKQPLPSHTFCPSLTCHGTSRYTKTLSYRPGSCTQLAELGLQTLAHLTASVIAPHIAFLLGGNKLDNHYKQEDYEDN